MWTDYIGIQQRKKKIGATKLNTLRKKNYYELTKEEVLGFYCTMNVIKHGYLWVMGRAARNLCVYAWNVTVCIVCQVLYLYR